MNLLSQILTLNRMGSGASTAGGGGVLGFVLGFIALLFSQPYYNAFIKSSTAAIGISPFEPVVPLSLMAIAFVTFVGSIFVLVGRENQNLLTLIFKTIIGLSTMIVTVPLFVFSLIHWAFYSS